MTGGIGGRHGHGETVITMDMMDTDMDMDIITPSDITITTACIIIRTIIIRGIGGTIRTILGAMIRIDMNTTMPDIIIHGTIRCMATMTTTTTTITTTIAMVVAAATINTMPTTIEFKTAGTKVV